MLCMTKLMKVSDEAHKNLKVRAAQEEKSILELIDELALVKRIERPVLCEKEVNLNE